MDRETKWMATGGSREIHEEKVKIIPNTKFACILLLLCAGASREFERNELADRGDIITIIPPTFPPDRLPPLLLRSLNHLRVETNTDSVLLRAEQKNVFSIFHLSPFPSSLPP